MLLLLLLLFFSCLPTRATRPAFRHKGEEDHAWQPYGVQP